MIRSKDENTTKSRKLDNKVPLEELPNLMRAMGYYPTEQEVQNMNDEVKFSIFSDEGKATTSVELDQFIKLFVNHRPVYGIGKNNIEEAFKTLAIDAGDMSLSRGKYHFLLILNRGTQKLPSQRRRAYYQPRAGQVPAVALR